MHHLLILMHGFGLMPAMLVQTGLKSQQGLPKLMSRQEKKSINLQGTPPPPHAPRAKVDKHLPCPPHVFQC